MKKRIAPLAAGLLLLTSCAKDKISGNGPVTTENRTVSHFTEVSTVGSSDVHIVHGTSFSVQVKGYSNLLPYFETNVVNNTLHVGYQQGANIHNNNIEVFVTMPTFEGARIDGSADIDVKGAFSSNSVAVSVYGSGTIAIEAGTTRSITAVFPAVAISVLLLWLLNMQMPLSQVVERRS